MEQIPTFEKLPAAEFQAHYDFLVIYVGYIKRLINEKDQKEFEERGIVPQPCEDTNMGADLEKHGIRNLAPWMGSDGKLCSDYILALKQAILNKLGSETEVGTDLELDIVNGTNKVTEWQKLSKMDRGFMIVMTKVSLDLKNAYEIYQCFINVTDSNILTDDKFESLDRRTLQGLCKNCNDMIDLKDMIDHTYKCLELQKPEGLTLKKLGITIGDTERPPDGIKIMTLVQENLGLTPEQKDRLAPNQLTLIIHEQVQSLYQDIQSNLSPSPPDCTVQ